MASGQCSVRGGDHVISWAAMAAGLTTGNNHQLGGEQSAGLR